MLSSLPMLPSSLLLVMLLCLWVTVAVYAILVYSIIVVAVACVVVSPHRRVVAVISIVV